MKIYQDYVNAIIEAITDNSEIRFAAQQLLKMHDEALSRHNPIIVELGVDKGQSTRVFLNSIDGKVGAKLISIDIRDCSKAVDSDNWCFIQSNSTDIDAICRSAPVIEKGIDILYVDSLHTADHVYKELYSFFPYIKKDGVIFFDDIDSGPYKAGKRKDSVSVEVANRRIFKLLDMVFEANIDKLDFEVMRGSTGLAQFTKKSNLGDGLHPPCRIRDRRSKFFWQLLYLVTFKRTYRHKGKKKDVFLGEP